MSLWLEFALRQSICGHIVSMVTISYFVLLKLRYNAALKKGTPCVPWLVFALRQIYYGHALFP